MAEMSRRKFLQISMLAGSGLIASDWFAQIGRPRWFRPAFAAEPIRIGIIDPLTSPYKTSSIHDVHGATVAVDAFNKRGGVLGRPVILVEADDASDVQTAVKAAQKLIGQDRVDVLMGTFNGDVALAVSELAVKEDKLFMVTGAHIPELTGARCNARTFVFMPNATMMAGAVTPPLTKAYGTRWYMITADTVDGKSASHAMTRALVQQGGEVIGSSTTAFGSSDFSGAMAEARRAMPDAVIINL